MPTDLVDSMFYQNMSKLAILVSALGIMDSCSCWAMSSMHEMTSRKHFVAATSAAMTTIIGRVPYAASALDMDAFMEKELKQDAPKQMSDDERMCKFGAQGREKGEACKRAGMATNTAGLKVDAYGNIDRGNFVRCSTTYPMIDGQYVKTVTCN